MSSYYIFWPRDAKYSALTSKTVDTITPSARIAGRNRLSLEIFFAIKDANVITGAFLLRL